jgi:hypothetical protein
LRVAAGRDALGAKDPIVVYPSDPTRARVHEVADESARRRLPTQPLDLAVRVADLFAVTTGLGDLGLDDGLAAGRTLGHQIGQIAGVVGVGVGIGAVGAWIVVDDGGLGVVLVAAAREDQEQHSIEAPASHCAPSLSDVTDPETSGH